MIIDIINSLHETAPRTHLTSTEAAGTTIFRLANTNAFGSSWALQIGEIGQQQTEVLLLNGDPGAGTVGTSTVVSRYEHPADTPVYAIKYDQVVFERSTTGTAGTATPMTDGTITYQPNRFDLEDRQSYTSFDDTSGSTSYAYRVRFRNSVLGSNTIQSDWITPAGYYFYALSSIRQRIRDKIWDSSFIGDDRIINDWINELKDEFVNAVIDVDENYAMGTVGVSFGTAGLGTITTGDFSQVSRFEVTHNGVDYFLATKQYISDYVPDQIFSSTNPYYEWVGDTVFRVHPAESGGTASLTFYRFGTTMVNDTDELPSPMKTFTKSFVDYGKLQAQYKDGKVNQDTIDNFLAREKSRFTSHIVPRDKSQVSSIKIVESTTGDDFVW